jgi:hypothetical protein
MADVKISQLPAATSPVASTDVLPVVQGGATKKASVAQLGFLQAGGSAATRTIQDKLRDIVSVKDFGAAGDGVTNDTAAIQAAIAAILPTGIVFFPSGRYVHTGLTVSANITLRGESMTATTLINNTDTPSLTVKRTASSGALLNCGIFQMTLQGSTGASSAQHGLIIDGCSSGYLVDQVRCLQHGGDGFRIRAGSIGPMFQNIVARLNNGFGINFTSLDEDPGYNLFSSTSARLMFFVCSENVAGGVRINGGDTQDHDFHYFQYGLVESNGGTTAGTSGILLLNGVIGPSFRDIWIEDNNDHGIRSTTDGGAGGQIPQKMQFENIYFADHDVYAIWVEAGQYGTWQNLNAYGTGPTMFFANLTNAGAHAFYGQTLAFDAGGTGRSIVRYYNIVDEPYVRIEPGVRTDLLNIGADAFEVARTVTTTNATPQFLPIVSIPADTTYTFSIFIAARRTDADNESAGYRIEGVVDRNATAASTAFVGTPTVTVLGEDTAAWDVAVQVETANGGIRVLCTGEAAKTIVWNAVYQIVQVTG